MTIVSNQNFKGFTSDWSWDFKRGRMSMSEGDKDRHGSRVGVPFFPYCIVLILLEYTYWVILECSVSDRQKWGNKLARTREMSAVYLHRLNSSYFASFYFSLQLSTTMQTHTHTSYLSPFKLCTLFTMSLLLCWLYVSMLQLRQNRLCTYLKLNPMKSMTTVLCEGSCWQGLWVVLRSLCTLMCNVFIFLYYNPDTNSPDRQGWHQRTSK